jgi:hypothetical protein
MTIVYNGDDSMKSCLHLANAFVNVRLRGQRGYLAQRQLLEADFPLLARDLRFNNIDLLLCHHSLGLNFLNQLFGRRRHCQLIILLLRDAGALTFWRASLEMDILLGLSLWRLMRPGCGLIWIDMRGDS